MKLEIKNIRLDKSMQPRAYMNEDIIAEYAEDIKNGDEFPPITVYFDSVYYWLADGYHRYFGYKSLGISKVKCEVVKGTRRDAILYSVQANSRHGLRRTNEDKRKAVMTLLEDMEWSEWSDHKIAEACAVSHVTVGRIKKSLQIEPSGEKKYINKHGKESIIKTEKIGKKDKKPSEVTNLKPTEEVIEHEEEDKLKELAIEHEALAEENARLQDQLAVKNMDVSEEEKTKAIETMEELRAIIKKQEAEIRVLTNSRDQFQAKNAELIKQVTYWRKRAEKLSKETV